MIIFHLILLITLIPPSKSSNQNQPNLLRRLVISPQNTILTWVNGIGHGTEHMSRGQTSLSSIFCNRPVLFCHNPTAMTREDDYMGYIGDLTQAGTQKLGRITAEVNALVSHLKNAIHHVGPHGKVIHIAHSQGALITYLASKQLTKEEMKQMEVICFGGAEAIRQSKEFPFARCINYYSINDPLLFVVPSASKALRSGFLITTSTTLQQEPEFIFLTPRGGDPIVDHGLLGPTYIDALRWEARRYQRLYLPIWYPISQYIIMQCKNNIQYLEYVNQVIYLVIKTILKYTLLPLILCVMSVNIWLKEKVFVPIGALIVFVWEYLNHILLHSDKRFEPISRTS